MGTLLPASFLAGNVTVDASHRTGTCLVTRTFPLFGERHRRYDLATLHGADLRSRIARNGLVTYGVTLKTPGGEEDVSSSYVAQERQEQQRLRKAAPKL